MIILLGAFLLGGAVAATGVFGTGKSLDDLDKAVKKDVADEARKSAARQVIGQWKADVKKFTRESGDRQKALTGIMRRHDATRQELDALIAGQTLASAEIERLASDHRFALKAQLTRGEWARLFGAAEQPAPAAGALRAPRPGDSASIRLEK